MALNAHSPLPLYQQLAERIRTDVENGVYAVGEKIPSEYQLAAQYAIGRPTVRQATDLLVRQGCLQRRRGSGTYVLPAKQQIDLLSLTGTSTALQHSELAAQIEITIPPYLLAEDAKKPAHFGAKVYYLQRVSRIAETPVLLENVYLDGDLFYGFDQQFKPNKSLSRTVRDVYFLEASSAEQSFDIYFADKTIAKQLQINSQAALLHVARTLHFGEHTAAIYCDIYCRTERFHFSQTIFSHPQPTVFAENTSL